MNGLLSKKQSYITRIKVTNKEESLTSNTTILQSSFPKWTSQFLEKLRTNIKRNYSHTEQTPNQDKKN